MQLAVLILICSGRFVVGRVFYSTGGVRNRQYHLRSNHNCLSFSVNSNVMLDNITLIHLISNTAVDTHIPKQANYILNHSLWQTNPDCLINSY